MQRELIYVTCKNCKTQVAPAKASIKVRHGRMVATCLKCLDGSTGARPSPVPEVPATKEHFYQAYISHLKRVFKWANQEPDKLWKFMASVRTTMTSERATWNHTGACVTAAWHSIGMTGKPTLKALRELPDQAPETPALASAVSREERADDQG